MMGKKKKLAPLLVALAILLITTLEMVPEVVAGDDELQCNVWWPLCSGVCYKPGKCMRCCKHYGYRHGRCSLIHRDACYCCRNPGAGEQQRMLRVIERSPPPRRPRPPPIQGSSH